MSTFALSSQATIHPVPQRFAGLGIDELRPSIVSEDERVSVLLGAPRASRKSAKPRRSWRWDGEFAVHLGGCVLSTAVLTFGYREKSRPRNAAGLWHTGAITKTSA
ncbi:hypothetical protein WDW86_07220 [Bdellovibrionota bacterium FG-2]